jgi:hypothetical protein
MCCHDLYLVLWQQRQKPLLLHLLLPGGVRKPGHLLRPHCAKQVPFHVYYIRPEPVLGTGRFAFCSVIFNTLMQNKRAFSRTWHDIRIEVVNCRAPEVPQAGVLRVASGRRPAQPAI